MDHRVYENDERLKIGYNCFARMRLQADQLSVEFVDRYDTVTFSETWKTEGGVLTRV